MRRLLAAVAAACLLLGGRAAQADPPASRTDRVLVRVASRSALKDLLDTYGADVLEEIDGTDWVTVKVPSSKSAKTWVGSLKAATSAVDDTQEDRIYAPPEGDGSTLPAGGYLLSAQLPDQDEILRIGAEAARARATGEGVRVAVVDTGVLEIGGVADNLDGDGWDTLDDDDDPTDETDGLDDDDDDLTDELYAHGTFVASLIVAVAPDARIVPFRALNADGIGTSLSVATAILRAADAEVDVINLSVSIAASDSFVHDAIQAALNRGVQVVVSAGNDAEEAEALPTSIERALVVTAVDADDVKADFANWGGSVDLSAPGVDLSGSYPESPGTAVWSGTSFSAALATGGFALVKELHPSWSNAQVRAKLGATAVSTDDANSEYVGALGAGRLDLDAATAP